jgi:hypothetical protein
MTCGESLSHVWQVASLPWDSSGHNTSHILSTALASAVLVVRLGARRQSRVSIHGYKAITGKSSIVSRDIGLTLARNVGLFRYWTLPNIPLFVIAAPMLWLLLVSSGTVLCSPLKPLLHGRPVPQHGATSDPTETSATAHCVPELALPQFVLAVAAFVSFHVQIVNRLASGYPTWYLMVATWLVDDSATSDYSRPQRQSRWIVRGMVSYALAQGMLFANFLPPA